MTSNDHQRIQRKRTTRKAFTPSDSDRYVLIRYGEGGEYEIIKYADVQSEKDGEVELRTGEVATFISTGKFSLLMKREFVIMIVTVHRLGTHADCRARLKAQNDLLKSNDYDLVPYHPSFSCFLFSECKFR